MAGLKPFVWATPARARFRCSLPWRVRNQRRSLCNAMRDRRLLFLRSRIYGPDDAAARCRVSARAAQGLDALFQWRMRHEQPRKAVSAARDAKGAHLRGQLRLFLSQFQSLQSGDHLFTSSERRTACVRAEFAQPAKPHHDDAGQDTEHQFGHDRSNPERRTVAAFGFENNLVDQIANNARQEYNESVHDALN